tara:strand:+ start:2444 stop:2575 length:132 start_codon:yes stop_codon:yes gene_type:complete
MDKKELHRQLWEAVDLINGECYYTAQELLRDLINKVEFINEIK